MPPRGIGAAGDKQNNGLVLLGFFPGFGSPLTYLFAIRRVTKGGVPPINFQAVYRLVLFGVELPVKRAGVKVEPKLFVELFVDCLGSTLVCVLG